MQKIYGIHTVEALIHASPKQVATLYVQENREDQRLKTIRQLADAAHIPLKMRSRANLDALLADGGRHQGVIADVTEAPHYTERDLMKLTEIDNVLLLILDGVQDPHNLGACLRSANALGVHAVIAPKDRAVGMTAAVRKVACGAAEVTPFIPVANLSRTLTQLKAKAVWLVGAVGETETLISDIDLSTRIGLVMGAEGKGLRRLTREHCDYLASIPMQGSVSSFNVSVATGICLYEINRQRSTR